MPGMINAIHTRSYIEDINMLATAIINTLKSVGFSTDVYMNMQLNKLIKNNENLTEAIKNINTNSNLSEKYIARDNAYRALYFETKVKKMWFDKKVIHAATMVLNVIEKYRSESIHPSSPIQSSHLNGLLGELDKPEMKAAILQLPSINTLIEQLITRQKDFEANYGANTELQIEENKLLSASKLKRGILKQINTELILYMNAMLKAKPEVFKIPAEQINALINEHNKKIRARGKRRTRYEKSNN